MRGPSVTFSWWAGNPWGLFALPKLVTGGYLAFSRPSVSHGLPGLDREKCLQTDGNLFSSVFYSKNSKRRAPTKVVNTRRFFVINQPLSNSARPGLKFVDQKDCAAWFLNTDSQQIIGEHTQPVRGAIGTQTINNCAIGTNFDDFLRCGTR